MKIFKLGRNHYKPTMTPDAGACDVLFANTASTEFPESFRCNACNGVIGFKKPICRTLEWLPGSAVIGDFTWDARIIAEPIITDRVRRVLEQNVRGLEYLNVNYWQDPKVKPPKRITKRNIPRIWLPYVGPKQYVMWTCAWVHADRERSSIILNNKECHICGVNVYDIVGIEEYKTLWSEERGTYETHIDRKEGMGFFVHKEDLGDVGVFRIYERGGALFCTQEVRDIIEARAFTNIEFLEFGEIV